MTYQRISVLSPTDVGNIVEAAVGVSQFKVKKANQTVTGTTLVDDSELFFNIGAGNQYTFEAVLITSTGALSGIKFGWTMVPGSGILAWQTVGTSNPLLSAVDTVVVNLLSTGDNLVILKGIVTAGTAPVNFNLRFATATGLVAGATVKAGSVLKMLRVK